MWAMWAMWAKRAHCLFLNLLFRCFYFFFKEPIADQKQKQKKQQRLSSIFFLMIFFQFGNFLNVFKEKSLRCPKTVLVRMSAVRELVQVCKTTWGCEPTIKISRFNNYKSPQTGLPIYTVEIFLPDKRHFQTTGYGSVNEMKEQMSRAALRSLGQQPAKPITPPLNADKKAIPRKERWRVHVHCLLADCIDDFLLEHYPDVTFIVFTTNDALTKKQHLNYHEVEVCPKLDSKLDANKIVLRIVNETQLAYLSIVAEAMDNVLNDNLMGVSVFVPQGTVADAIPSTEQDTFVKLAHTVEDLERALAAFRAIVPLSN